MGSGTAAASLAQSDLLQGTIATLPDVGDAGTSTAELAGPDPGSGSPARGTRARRHPGDRDRMILRLFLTV